MDDWQYNAPDLKTKNTIKKIGLLWKHSPIFQKKKKNIGITKALYSTWIGEEFQNFWFGQKFSNLWHPAPRKTAKTSPPCEVFAVMKYSEKNAAGPMSEIEKPRRQLSSNNHLRIPQ